MHPRARGRGDIDYLYTDEDKIDLGGTIPTRSSSPTGRPSDCAARCTRATSASSGARARRGRPPRPGYDGSQDWDLVLRVTEQARKVHHVPEVLYHWRVHSTSVALDAMAKPTRTRPAAERSKTT